jgi:hypothetical protein
MMTVLRRAGKIFASIPLGFSWHERKSGGALVVDRARPVVFSHDRTHLLSNGSCGTPFLTVGANAFEKNRPKKLGCEKSLMRDSEQILMRVTLH